ncbi:MAG: 30S ribosomal protein S20 [Chlamydiae bacterium]|nr:MAG: 30S ribosomal protein S20 [Chlamydiota bacterium]
MPSHKHREKKIRQDEKRKTRNTKVKSKIKTLSKKVRAAAVATDTADMDKLVREAAAAIDSAATKGVIHKRAASRRVSRLAKLRNKSTTAQPTAVQSTEAAE